jgi:imidazolonepropionase
MSSNKHDFLTKIVNAKQLVILSSGKKLFKRGKDMNDVEIIENGSMVIGHDGLIVSVGTAAEIDLQFKSSTFTNIIDCTGKAVIPGLVDAHTHPVWSGDRVHEFKAKLAGATYMDIHKMGGGIGFTVRHVHASSESQLIDLFLKRLDRMMKFGTTLVEAKSGYGLDLENEVKMLKAIQTAQLKHPLDIVANFCGAHSVPKGMTADEATQNVINVQIPEIAKLKQQGVINPTQIDVFCEKGVFEHDHSRKILEAGKANGFSINFHGDELNPTNSAELGADLGAAAISHLECISDQGIKAMAEKKVVGVLLPTTAYVLRIHPPPARKMIDEDVIIALGSDFNPNAHCLSMPMVMNFACVLMKMTVNEALVAATLNSAAALEKSAGHGSLEVGKKGDCVIIDSESWEHIVYEIADPPILSVIKDGKIVYERL